MNLRGNGIVQLTLTATAVIGTLSPTDTGGGADVDRIEGGGADEAFADENTATVRLVIRKATNAQWNTANPTLALGEIGFITDLKNFVIGDGSTAFQDLTDANFFVNYSDVLDAINGLLPDVSGITSDVTTLENNVSSLFTLASQLQAGLNTHEAEITTLQSDVTTLQGVDTSLQGQIDALSTTVASGIIQNYQLNLSLGDIDGAAESNLEIILPSAGKCIVPFHATALMVSNNTSGGQSAIRLKNDADVNVFPDYNIADDASTNGLNILKINKSDAPVLQVDGSIILYFTLGSSWAGADGTLQINIFYLEV